MQLGESCHGIIIITISIFSCRDRGKPRPSQEVCVSADILISGHANKCQHFTV